MNISNIYIPIKGHPESFREMVYKALIKLASKYKTHENFCERDVWKYLGISGGYVRYWDDGEDYGSCAKKLSWSELSALAYPPKPSLASPCKERGYEVGDLFSYTGKGSFEKDSILQLIKDNGNVFPKMMVVCGAFKDGDSEAGLAHVDNLKSLKGHEHYKLMLEYAEDVKKYGKDAYKNWEVSAILSGDWLNCEGDPQWNPLREYRRKPSCNSLYATRSICEGEIIAEHNSSHCKPTITIGDMEIVAPVRVALEEGQHFYVPRTDIKNLYMQFCWYGDSYGERCLKAGMVHLSKENAQVHAAALIKVSGDGTRGYEC